MTEVNDRFVDYDFHGQALRRFKFFRLEQDPQDPTLGEVWFNTSLGQHRYFDGIAVTPFGGSSNQTFERVSQNLSDLPKSFVYLPDESIARVIYDSAGITKEFTYLDNGSVETVTLIGVPGLEKNTKRFTYTGELIQSVTYEASA